MDGILLTMPDIATIILYLLIVLYVGYFYSKKVKNMKDYVLGGKQIPLVICVGTLMASWYCTFSFAEYAFIGGISVWVTWGIAGSVGKIPMALWVGPKVQFADALTMPEMMQKIYDKKTGILAAFILVFYCTALYGVTGLRIVGESVFGMDPGLFALIVTAIVVALALMGGLLSVAITDLIQMIFMIVGVAVAVFFAWNSVNGWDGIISAYTAMGIEGNLKPLGTSELQAVIVLAILSFSSYADPSFYQRFSASDSPRTARRALLICLCVWLMWDACVCVLGLVARVQFPDAAPGTAYLSMVLSQMPAVLRGLFMCGMIGAILSSLSSYWLVGGTCIARDIYAVVINPNASEKNLITLTRFGIVFMGLIGLLLAGKFSMMATAWTFVGSLWLGGALVPVVGGLFYPGRISAIGGFWSMVCGLGAIGLFNYISTPFGVDPLFVAVPISLIVFVVGGRFGKESNVNKEGGVIRV